MPGAGISIRYSIRTKDTKDFRGLGVLKNKERGEGERGRGREALLLLSLRSDVDVGSLRQVG